MLSVGSKAPEFTAYDQDGNSHSLSEFFGKLIVLYFYPKDDTPGCTMEACSIRDNFAKLTEKASILGVSSDSTLSHKQFAIKYNLPFILLSDPQKEIIKMYEADGLFTKRITYLIDKNGIIIKIYPQVNPSSHASELINDLNNLS